MFYKIIAGVLSTLAVATGTVMAIPASREFVLDTLAPYSQVYEQQVDKSEELENVYNINLETLDITREELANAESQFLSYQENLTIVQTELLNARNNLDNTNNELAIIRSNFNNAEQEIARLQNDLDDANTLNNQLNMDLINLNQQYLILQEQYNQALINGNQSLIDDLYMQISNLAMERDSLYMQVNDMQYQIDDLYMQLDMERMNRDFYEMQIMDMQMEIDIVEQEKEDLQIQLNNQQATIDQLNQEITHLNEIKQDLEDGSIVFNRSITTLLFPTYNNGTLTGFTNIQDTSLETCLGYLLQGSYLQQCIENSVQVNEKLNENNSDIRINTADEYQVLINSTSVTVQTNLHTYFFAQNISMNVQYLFNGITMSSEELISNVNSDTTYNYERKYGFTIDDNSKITSLTCYFRVMEIS